MSNLIKLFNKWYKNKKKTELSSPKDKLINTGYKLTWVFYLFENLFYLIIYNIIKPYKNYLKKRKFLSYNQFYMILSKTRIKIKYKFGIY